MNEKQTRMCRASIHSHTAANVPGCGPGDLSSLTHRR